MAFTGTIVTSVSGVNASYTQQVQLTTDLMLSVQLLIANGASA